MTLDCVVSIFAFRYSSATLVLLMSGRTRGRFLRLSVIVAVRDVEDSVGRDVRNLAEHLRQRGIAFEILAASDGSCDTSLTLLRFLACEIPELMVLGGARAGRALRRAVVEAQGEAVLLWDADRGNAFPHAFIGWALSRLGGGSREWSRALPDGTHRGSWQEPSQGSCICRDAVIVRGRFILASRLRALPILLETSGWRDDYEARFERRAANLGLDLEIVGRRSRQRRHSLLAPVLRILSV